MREFEDATPLLGRPEALRERLDAESHLFFRGLIPSERVFEVRRAVVGELDELGWLEPGHDVMDAVRGANARGEGHGPSPEFFEAYIAIQSLQLFHELAHDEHILDVVERVVGEPVLTHPRKIFRITPAEDPASVTPPHQDFRLIQGTVDVLTLWTPIGDCPPELGGLRVLAGSHRRGLENVSAVKRTGGVTVPADDDDPNWTSTSFQAGDVLIFHSLTVHGAIPNVSDRLRLSADYRYQARSQPVVEGSLVPHYHPSVPSYDVLTQGWSSTWSVDVPEGLEIATMHDPFERDMPVPAPKLVTVPD